MPDHAQLLAEIEQCELRLKQAVMTPWARADLQRRYAHYRRILDRHTLVPYSDEETFLWCPGCGYSEGDYCADIRDLADALGLGEHHDH